SPRVSNKYTLLLLPGNKLLMSEGSDLYTWLFTFDQQTKMIYIITQSFGQ
ncbi:14417_t:CDS:1, partial [Racocetra fulgida]